MTTSQIDGPLSVGGQKPPMLGTPGYTGAQPALVDSNQDLAPSLFWMGIGIRDPRYLQRIGAGSLQAGGYKNQDCGWFFAGQGIDAIDAVPSPAVANNIAASQAITNGGVMTLAGASTGITVLAAPLTILPTGNVIPAGCLVLDGNPVWVGGGSSGGFAFLDPSTALTRALVVATGNVTIRGFDLYGVPITQTLTAATTTKAFKFVQSITGNAVGAGVTVGTADVFGLPIRSNEFARAQINWANALLTANTGYVSAVTATATALTGDVRGTFATPTASDGTRKLTIDQTIPFSVIASTYATAVTSLLGVNQF